MSTETRMGYERIDRSLAGQDMEHTELGYTDAYLRAVNELYGQHDIIAHLSEAVAQEDLNALGRLVFASPAQNEQAERVLATILHQTGQNRRWSTRHIEGGNIDFLPPSVERLAHSGLAHAVGVMNGLQVLPSQYAVEHFIKRFEDQ